MTRFISKFVDKVSKIFHNHLFKRILDTKPIKIYKDADVLAVSLLYHDALHMSIVALKSFILSFGKIDLTILNDGSLTDSDIKLLKLHFVGAEIVNITTIHSNHVPRGNCWERLLYILKESKSRYVIQVDTDTLTIGKLEEVKFNASNNIAFTIGEPDWFQPVPLSVITNFSKEKKDLHIQCLAESYLDKIDSIQLKDYVRGCAAFTGFPKGNDLYEQLILFSKEMAEILGDTQWNKWGSEQFASNVMISLCNPKSVLTWPDYQNHGFPFYSKRHVDYINLELIHFIGTHRFKNLTYYKLTKIIIENIVKNRD